ncbi:MAG: hypothetical protein IMW92_03565 [Bacillales bacterium]|nr:hypothetical protein [Bacillales bacterium]
MQKGDFSKTFINKKTRRESFFSPGFLYFGTFILKQAVFFRLFQKGMGDGNQNDREIGETPAGKARKEPRKKKAVEEALRRLRKAGEFAISNNASYMKKPVLLGQFTEFWECLFFVERSSLMRLLYNKGSNVLANMTFA